MATRQWNRFESSIFIFDSAEHQIFTELLSVPRPASSQIIKSYSFDFSLSQMDVRLTRKKASDRVFLLTNSIRPNCRMQRLSKKYFASNLYKTQVVQVQHVSAFVFFLVPFVPLCVSRHFIFESCTAHGASLLGSTEPIAYDCIYRFRLQTQSIGKETSNVCPAREYRSVSKLDNNRYIVHEYLTHRNQFPIIHLLSIFFSFFQ